eukprot:TRINITY_DN35441_c0_g1_i1.p1 TRINITY_DN35441_c0_g1~~TRINITY_DN35441_c0_g1_i1.p1  ORF type:complete len:547 (-),score=82.04 TRINITY_DN35441_c0_g1_i1:115-1689(-)
MAYISDSPCPAGFVPPVSHGALPLCRPTGSSLATVQQSEVPLQSHHTHSASSSSQAAGGNVVTASLATLTLIGLIRRRNSQQRRSESAIVRRARLPKPAPAEYYAPGASTPSRDPNKKHRHQGGRWRTKKIAEEAALMNNAELHTGEGMVFGSAAEVAAPAHMQRELEEAGKAQEENADESALEGPSLASVDSSTDSQGRSQLNVIERARLAAESGHNERLYEQEPDDIDWETARSSQQYRQRLRRLGANKNIDGYVNLSQLGERARKRLPKGERWPTIFSGSDPAHNGMRYSKDDGNDDPVGVMANRVHKGFLRLRATSYTSGLRGQHGVYPPAERPEIALIGCGNVGKSSLLNSITRTQHLAKADDEWGVTRHISWYKCSNLPIDILDLPGYGWAKGADFGELLTNFVCNRKALRALYILVDARKGLRHVDWNWLQFFGNVGPPRVFVMTKCDLLKPKYVARSATALLDDIKIIPRASDRLLMVSARLGHGMHDFRKDICARAVNWAEQARKKARQLEEASS